MREEETASAVMWIGVGFHVPVVQSVVLYPFPERYLKKPNHSLLSNKKLRTQVRLIKISYLHGREVTDREYNFEGKSGFVGLVTPVAMNSTVYAEHHPHGYEVRCNLEIKIVSEFIEKSS